ncbi:MAG: hypothetical protein QNJ22_05945 [Desulfosarcinaceae bacterium]|nr:hypothetical protein [Desulfosarcinaceae bacterium]
MGNLIIKAAVHTLFTLTSRQRAIHQSAHFLRSYRRLVDGVPTALGRRRTSVPPLPGIDEEMRDWSLFMILEHNAIVNRSITAITAQLARNEPLSGPALIDMKSGVLPAANSDERALSAFQRSVTAHLKCVATLGPLRGTPTAAHPIFGNFNAHCWHCMFAFHLRVHHTQAVKVVRALRGTPQR